MHGSFLKWMHARVYQNTDARNQKAILTDARYGLLGNGYAQGMGQILDARTRALYPGEGLWATPLTDVAFVTS